MISAAHIQQCRAAQPYIVPAIELHEALLGVRDFMYAATACYLEIGAVPTAEYALRSLERRDSAVGQDPMFQQLVKATQAAKKAGSSPP